MLSNILPVVAIAGVALAACPIAVEIASVEGHTAEVTLTNTAATPITFFKGNTVLSPHATLDLLVSDAGMSFDSDFFFQDEALTLIAGNELPFEGIFVNYKKSGIDASMFQTLAAGESITASVNAAKTYQLSGIESASISALQGFHYVEGTVAPTAIKGSAFCESSSTGSVAITPIQAVTAA